MSSFSYCLNDYIFSGVPPLKQFFKFTLVPVENTTLMVDLLSLQLTSEIQSFYSCEKELVLTLVCPTYQLVVSVDWVGLWEEVTLMASGRH